MLSRSDLFPEGFPPDISRMLSSSGQEDNPKKENSDIFCEGSKEKDFLSSHKTCQQKRTLKSASSSLERSHTNFEENYSKKVSDEPANQNEIGYFNANMTFIKSGNKRFFFLAENVMSTFTHGCQILYHSHQPNYTLLMLQRFILTLQLTN